MKLLTAFSLGIASAALAPVSANAATLFSDSFQAPLSSSNWATIGSATIVGSPVGGGNALHFTAGGSGGDLFSQIIPATGAGTYQLKVDYFCANANGCAGFIGLAPGGSVSTNPQTNNIDNWLVTDAAGNYPTGFIFQTNTEGFVTNTFSFSVGSNTPFALKLEDFAGGTDGGVAGNAYFRNLSLSSAVPEPATWAMLLLGFGMIGFAMRKRSNVRTTVSYA
jgi:hypothetical protein